MRFKNIISNCNWFLYLVAIVANQRLKERIWNGKNTICFIPIVLFYEAITRDASSIIENGTFISKKLDGDNFLVFTYLQHSR